MVEYIWNLQARTRQRDKFCRNNGRKTVSNHKEHRNWHFVGNMGSHHGQIFHSCIFFPSRQGTADTGLLNGSYERHHGHKGVLLCTVRCIREGMFHNTQGDIRQLHHNDILVRQKRHLDSVDSSHGDIAIDIDNHIRVFCCKLLYKCDNRRRYSIDLKIRVRLG